MGSPCLAGDFDAAVGPHESSRRMRYRRSRGTFLPTNSEPRSNSLLTGDLLTSFWRARRVCSRIIHKTESAPAASVNL